MPLNKETKPSITLKNLIWSSKTIDQNKTKIIYKQSNNHFRGNKTINFHNF